MMPVAERTRILRDRYTSAELQIGLLTPNGEVAYEGYGRQSVEWGEPEQRDDGSTVVVNTNTMRWATVPRGAEFIWSGWFAVDGSGEVRNQGNFAVPRQAEPGDEPKIAGGTATIGLRDF